MNRICITGPLLAVLLTLAAATPALAEPPPPDVAAATTAYRHVQDCPGWAVRIEPGPDGPRAVCPEHGELHETGER